MDGINIGGGFVTMPVPLVEKIAKFMATAHYVMEGDGADDAKILAEMKIWLDDPQLKQFVRYIISKMIVEGKIAK